MNKLTTILILAIIAVGAWLLLRDAAPSEVTAPVAAPAVEAQPEVSPTADLNAELELIDVGDVDADLQAVDADLNQL